MITYYKHQLENTIETIESLRLSAKHINSSSFLINWNADYVWYTLAAAEKAGCHAEIYALIADVLVLSQAQKEEKAIEVLKQQGVRSVVINGKTIEILPKLDLKINW
jgi:hypothetical protein